MGNSEIGHTAIGAGKAIDTDLVRIKKSIEIGTFHENKVLTELFDHVLMNNSRIHMLGLLSDGGVHSHQDHVFAFLELAKKKGLRKDQVVFHAFTDGRDAMPKMAATHLQTLEDKMNEIGIGVWGSFGGRYFGMDRAENWDRIAMVEDILFECKGKVCDVRQTSVPAFMKQQYVTDPTGKIDEYMEHFLVRHENDTQYSIQKNDGIFFFNFRADRARQLSTKILERKDALNLYFATMTQYGESIDTNIVFPSELIETCLAKELSKEGISQAHISESEKYPHVTFFINGQSDVVHEREEHINVPSRTDIATHDMAPEMMAKEIVDKAIEVLQKGTEFVLINFPNADVVGHTGNIPAIVASVEVVDQQTKRLVEFIQSIGGAAIVTADHGNAELNIDPVTGDKHTAHTINPIPFVFVSEEKKTLKNTGTLADITPTVLDHFGIEKPDTMTGSTLVS